MTFGINGVTKITDKCNQLAIGILQFFFQININI